MRIRRLELLRYGHFTDAVMEFPVRLPDLHIVFGPNEAGKSTALSALEDFLFGIPHNSPLNFLHDYPSMRVGAVLEDEGHEFSALRRKGRRDTLLSRHEVPIPGAEGDLARFLAGADRSFFSRMFSLDHSRLRQGGREILEAQDEVGRMLFSVGTGIAGLRDRLKDLEREADALWGTRRAAHRKYYQAEDRLKAAENALRKHTVTAAEWQDIKRAHDAAREAYGALEREIEARSAELRKLNRIRRVFRDVRRACELASGIESLGEVTLLPEDARGALREAEEKIEQTVTRIETLTEQLEAVRGERAALVCDESLLLRAQDIHHLNERRIQVRAGKADLPKRRAELAGAEAAMRSLAAELEWEAADVDRVLSRLPTRARSAAARALISSRGGLLSGLENARKAVEEAETRLAEVVQGLAELGTPADVSRLAAAVEATRAGGDVGSRIRAVESEIRDLDAAIHRHLALLKPEVPDVQTLESIPVPPRDTVQGHRDERRDLDQRTADCRARTGAAELQLERHRKAYDRVAFEEHAVSPEELARVRRHRDTGWSLIRRKYIDGVAVPEDRLEEFAAAGGELPDLYEAAVRTADETADRRFDKAEAAARLAEISRQIADQKDLLEDLQAEARMLAERGVALDAAWEEMWKEAPFPPLSPDTMLEWMAARSDILSLVERRASAQRQLASLLGEEREAADRLRSELEALGMERAPWEDRPLSMVLEAAAEVLRRHRQVADDRRKLEETRRRVQSECERKGRELERARSDWTDWNTRWADALARLGLDAATLPQAVEAQLDVIDRMREVAVKIDELRHERIEKIEQFIAAFNRDVEETIRGLAPDLAAAEPDEAVLQLQQRLKEAERVRQLQAEKDEAVLSLEKKIQEWEELRREAGGVIVALQSQAGVESLEELRGAVGKSDSLRKFQAELEEVTRNLLAEGDGLSIAELQRECEGMDLDQVVVRAEGLEKELQGLRERLLEAREALTAARRAFEAIGADDAAARAAADRQAALAEMKETAERYVLVRSAALLLRWAIDRYRREKQAPLLKRAGRVFSTLTGGSFVDLSLAFDEEDRAHLAGVRPDGGRVAVGGMSTGTADQLYLALRVASVEDYLERAAPLPFVADDLFINFDDTRAAAGMEVMARLAERTQVLFFTHHAHLLDIARRALGPDLSVISLLECTDDEVT